MRRPTRDMYRPPPVPGLSYRKLVTRSTSWAETPLRYADGPDDVASRTVPTPLATAKLVAAVVSDQAPPASALPQPSDTVRLNASVASTPGAATVIGRVTVSVAPSSSRTVRLTL